MLSQQVARGTGGHRRYSPQDVRWLRICTKLRKSGMPLAKIRRFAELVREGPGNEPSASSCCASSSGTSRTSSPSSRSAGGSSAGRSASTSSTSPRGPRRTSGREKHDRPYVHGYDERESERLHDQAGSLVDLLHHDTAYPAGSRVLEAGLRRRGADGHAGRATAPRRASCRSTSPRVARPGRRSVDAAGARQRRVPAGRHLRPAVRARRPSTTSSSASCSSTSPRRSTRCGGCSGC